MLLVPLIRLYFSKVITLSLIDSLILTFETLKRIVYSNSADFFPFDTYYFPLLRLMSIIILQNNLPAGLILEEM
jgi:hypothetical protein